MPTVIFNIYHKPTKGKSQTLLFYTIPQFPEENNSKKLVWELIAFLDYIYNNTIHFIKLRNSQM